MGSRQYGPLHAKNVRAVSDQEKVGYSMAFGVACPCVRLSRATK